MRQASLLIVFFAAVAVSASGCGGGGGTITPPSPLPTTSAKPTSTPTSTPVPIPTSSPYSVVAVATVPPPTPVPPGQTSAPIPVALPTAAGVSGTMNIPSSGSAISPGTAVALQLQNSSPNGVPTLSLTSRHTSLIHTMATTPITVIAYLGILFSQDVVLSQAPAFQFALPSSDLPPGTAYYLALYNPNQPSLGWQLGFEGPGTISGFNVTFTSSSASLYFQGWTWYYLGLYAAPISAATPTPAPSVAPTTAPTADPTSVPTMMPTAAPTPTPGATPTPAEDFKLIPAQMSFNGTGLTQTFSAVDLSYSGTFTATSADPHVATVTASGSTFTVTSVGAGTTSITVTESNGKTATCTITVTTTTIPIS